MAEALRLHAVTLLDFLELFLAVLDLANSPLGAVSLATEIFFLKKRHRDLGGKHQNEGRRIKTGMNLWGFHCCSFFIFYSEQSIAYT